MYQYLAQSGGAAIQVMNTGGGSGDGTLTNVVLVSVNSNGTQLVTFKYRAQSRSINEGSNN